MSNNNDVNPGYLGFTYPNTDCLFVGFQYDIIKYNDKTDQCIDIDLFCVQLDKNRKCNEFNNLCFYGNMGYEKTAPIEALRDIFGNFPWHYEGNVGDDDGLWIDLGIIPADTQYIRIVAVNYEYDGQVDTNLTIRIWHAERKGTYGQGLIKDLDRITMPCSFQDNKVTSIIEFYREGDKWKLEPAYYQTLTSVAQYLTGLGLEVD